MTGSSDAVLDCTEPGCALYKWRMGTPDEYRVQASEETRAKRLESLQKAHSQGRQAPRMDDLTEKVVHYEDRLLGEKTLVGSHPRK